MSKQNQLIAALTLLVVFSLLFFFHLGATLVTEPEEAVYAEVSREMYRDSEAVMPTLNGNGYFAQPPMLYWSQMLGYELFGINSLGARSVNALCGLATILIFFFCAGTPLGIRTAFNSAAILGSSVLFVYFSRVATTGMLLSMFLVISIVSFWFAVERSIAERNAHLLFLVSAFAGGCAILCTGPSALLFPAVTFIVYLISVRRVSLIFRLDTMLPAAAILLVTGCSWYVMLGFIHPGGFEFAKELFTRHLFDWFPQAAEAAPFFSSIAVLLIGLFPWVFYLPLAAAHGTVIFGRGPAARFVRIFVIFSIVAFGFLPFTAGGFSDLVLSALPGLALLTAALFNRETMGFPTLWLSAGWLAAALSIVTAVLLGASPLIIPYLSDLLGENSRNLPLLAEPVRLGSAVWIGVVLFIFSAVIIIRYGRTRDMHLVFQGLLLSSFIVSSTIFLILMPLYDRLLNQPLAALCLTAAEHTAEDGRIVLYSIGERPGVMFASARSTISLDDSQSHQLPLLFAEDDISVGITTNYYYARLLNHSIGVRQIDRQGGFVLFSANEKNSSVD
ncbi:MAG: glycosyltransferase family 39 protein [Desulfocapsaceae bacterium]|jgi:4-amino-4-deoxy-L-arabinose transferase-like glycosyltransferase|nr:glycosyltransferase family 39 protein [Desulfocapsaceae bacterium]